MTVCKRVLYSGRVQGVGFRYTVQRLAERLTAAGYVRNLACGDVELVAEGDEEDVDDLLRRVADVMSDHIRHAAVSNQTPQGLSGFEIVH